MDDINFEDLINKLEADDEYFWKVEYPKLSLAEKQKRWLKEIYSLMRIQGEATGDQYSAFSKSWYESAKEDEPQFDDIFSWVTKNLGFRLDWEKYYERISK